MLLKLNLARNSLRYIIRTYRIKELHIPYYLCNVIRKSIIKEGCKPIFYHIDDNFMPTKIFDIKDYILYPNYFGICDENIEILTQKYPKVIIDNAHSFFSEPKGFACFNSARKFMPVYNGSYLWIKDLSDNLDIQKSPLKYDLKYENLFNELEPYKISEELALYIEKFYNNNQRIDKFLKLHTKYNLSNLLEIKSFKSPFCYPYLAQTEEIADKLANELQKKGNTIYRYWNNMPKTFIEYKFYRRLVPIPI